MPAGSNRLKLENQFRFEPKQPNQTENGPPTKLKFNYTYEPADPLDRYGVTECVSKVSFPMHAPGCPKSLAFDQLKSHMNCGIRAWWTRTILHDEGGAYRAMLKGGKPHGGVTQI